MDLASGRLTALIVVGVLELFLGGIWVAGYFESELKIFGRQIETAPRETVVSDAAYIENLMPSGFGPRLVFRSAATNRFMFREQLFHFGFTYTPVMHGVLTTDTTVGKVTVVGRMNWYTLLFVVTFVAALGDFGLERPDTLIFVGALVGIVGVIYVTQARRFTAVANLVAANWQTLP